MTKADPESAAEVLKALAHATRLVLLQALAQGERPVGEIERDTGIGQPALSQQLGILRKAGLVSTRRDARQVFYSIDQQCLADIHAWLQTLTPSAATVQPLGNADAPSDARDSRGVAMFARIGQRRTGATSGG